LFSKKGQAQEILTYGIILFVLGIVIIIGFRLMTDINTQMQSADFISDQGKSGLNNFTNKFATVFDVAYFVGVILLAIIIIASVLLIDTNPIFLAVSIPALLAVLFANVILANALDDFGKSSAMVGLYDQLPLVQYVAGHWIQILAIVGSLALIFLYAKRTALGTQ